MANRRPRPSDRERNRGPQPPDGDRIQDFRRTNTESSSDSGTVLQWNPRGTPEEAHVMADAPYHDQDLPDLARNRRHHRTNPDQPFHVPADPSLYNADSLRQGRYEPESSRRPQQQHPSTYSAYPYGTHAYVPDSQRHTPYGHANYPAGYPPEGTPLQDPYYPSDNYRLTNQPEPYQARADMYNDPRLAQHPTDGYRSDRFREDYYPEEGQSERNYSQTNRTDGHHGRIPRSAPEGREGPRDEHHHPSQRDDRSEDSRSRHSARRRHDDVPSGRRRRP